MNRRTVIRSTLGVGLVGTTAGCLEALKEEAKTAKEKAESTAEIATKYAAAYANIPETITALDEAVAAFENGEYETVLSKTDTAISNASTMNEGFTRVETLASEHGIQQVQDAASTGIELTTLVERSATKLADAANAMQNDNVQAAQSTFEEAKSDLQQVKSLRDDLLTVEEVRNLV